MKSPLFTLAILTALTACSVTNPTSDPIPTTSSVVGSVPSVDGGANGGANGEAGSNGSNGVSGSNGATGKDGTNGTDNHIVKTWGCDFSVSHALANTVHATNCSDTAVLVKVWYFAEELSSGDMFVRAGVDDFGPGRVGKGDSSSEMWKAGSWEADNGKDYLLHDVCFGGPLPDANIATAVAATGNWSFTLNKKSNALTVLYTDSDMIGGSSQFVSQCQ